MPLWIPHKWIKYLQGYIARRLVTDGLKYYEKAAVQTRTQESARGAPPHVNQAGSDLIRPGQQIADNVPKKPCVWLLSIKAAATVCNHGQSVINEVQNAIVWGDADFVVEEQKSLGVANTLLF